MRIPELILAGVVAGVVATAMALLLRAPATIEPSDDPGLSEVRDELRALGTEVAALREGIRRAPLPLEDAAAPDASRMMDPRLDTVLAKTDELLERLAAQGKRGEEMAGLLTQLDADLEVLSSHLLATKAVEPMPESLPDAPPDMAKLNALRDESMSELTARHQLWDYQRVLDEYGRPSRVAPAPNGVGISFYYETGDDNALIIRFTGGKAYSAFWQY